MLTERRKKGVCDIWTKKVLCYLEVSAKAPANEVESYENEIFAHRAKRFLFLAYGEKKILYEEANVCTEFFFL